MKGFRTWLRSSVADPEVPSGVEVRHASKYVFVRSARNIDGEELMFTPKEWEEFLHGAALGEFNRPAGPPVEPADDVIDAVSAWTSAL
ncbi:DUF397 domain-containing protein [Kineosporia mesophila]|uniref:DUF397 domain-containing protein n=1 Tax=Kineosporia mesophila TaxID=566012 RepID=UPI001E431F33|nr:DUF397 domain-containing protein [Kineosporia mesophila]